MKRFATAAAFVAAGCLVGAGGAVAQDMKAMEKAIKYRQGVMKVVGWDFGPMAGMVKGKIPFDAAAFAMHAERVANMAPRALEGFPEGSGPGGTETRALPAIWEKWSDYETAMQRFIDESAKLVEVAKGGDEEAMKAQFGETGKSCKGCHDDFRKKKKS